MSEVESCAGSSKATTAMVTNPHLMSRVLPRGPRGRTDGKMVTRSGAKGGRRRPAPTLPPCKAVIDTQQVVRQTRRAPSRLVVFHLSPRSVNNKQPNREAIKPSEHANCMYAQCSEDFSIDVTPTRLPRTRAPSVCRVEQLKFTAIKQEINLLHKYEILEEFEDFQYHSLSDQITMGRGTTNLGWLS